MTTRRAVRQQRSRDYDLYLPRASPSEWRSSTDSMSRRKTFPRRARTLSASRESWNFEHEFETDRSSTPDFELTRSSFWNSETDLCSVPMGSSRSPRRMSWASAGELQTWNIEFELNLDTLDSVGLCPDWEDWDPKNAKKNAKEAMDAAENWLDVPQVRPHTPSLQLFGILVCQESLI